MTRHNYNQRIERLNREVAHFAAQISKYSGADTPRGKASLTRSTICLMRRLRDLKKLRLRLKK